MKYLMLMALATASLSGCSSNPKISDPRIEYPPAPEQLMRAPVKLKPIIVPEKQPQK